MGTSRKRQDGLELLRNDHRRTRELIERYAHLGAQGDAQVKQEVAQRISAEVLLHSRLEESTLYPIAREALDAEDVLDEALVEH